MSRVRLIAAIAVACVALASDRAVAQQFGRNKVEYDDLHFQVLRSEHFDIYYSPEDQVAMQLVARMAERWYARLSRVLDHALTDRQPLVLYSSHREFAHTNVIGGILDESIGGVTESLRRRIVMPFAAGLAETDHVLGHELVHAFQYDIARRHRTNINVPLWVAEGMAEYLSQGPLDPYTVTWLRDASAHRRLPSIEKLDTRGVSPYRIGQAFWAYVGGRFGDQSLGQILKTQKPRKTLDRIAAALDIDLKALSDDWHESVKDTFDVEAGSSSTVRPRRLITTREGGRLNIGPSLSPDGRYLTFFSERDGLSIDLFLADASTGTILRRLTTTATDATLESVQSVQSAGAWDRTGRRFMFPGVRRGKPVLTMLDPSTGKLVREISLPQLGEIMTPTFSPDGSAVAFTALKGGLSDLFLFDLKKNALQQLTHDQYTDLQPAWSPDGRRLAFVTDRFTSDLAHLDFGALQLAFLDLTTNDIQPIARLESAKQVNPAWSADGRSLLFISDPDGISNVYRLDLSSSLLYQVTASTGVIGLTPTSPALSVAGNVPKIAWSTLAAGRFEIDTLEGAADMEGRPAVETRDADFHMLPPRSREDARLTQLLGDPNVGMTDRDIAAQPTPYNSQLSLQAVLEPYFSSGGGRYGGFVRGGAAMLFGDMLGEQAVGAAIQMGNRRDDVGFQVRYLNRSSRWNWGSVAELIPTTRGRRIRTTESSVDGPLVREVERLRQYHAHLAGVVMYPFSRSRRVEFSGGVRHIAFDRSMAENTYSSNGLRLLDRETWSSSSGVPATSAEFSAAFVHDTTVFGPTSPIAGSRWRLEVAPTVGDLKYTTVLADYRRYAMPARPYTIALRLLHTGRYGPDADDPRLIHYYLGSRQLVRGYADDTIIRTCQSTVAGECPSLDDLLGSRLLLTKVEFRAPLIGAFNRTLRYGIIPAEIFAFADAGLTWNRAGSGLASSRLLRSVGTGIRLNAFLGAFEIAAARPLEGPLQSWRFAFNLQPGF